MEIYYTRPRINTAVLVGGRYLLRNGSEIVMTSSAPVYVGVNSLIGVTVVAASDDELGETNTWKANGAFYHDDIPSEWDIVAEATPEILGTTGTTNALNTEDLVFKNGDGVEIGRLSSSTTWEVARPDLANTYSFAPVGHTIIRVERFTSKASYGEFVQTTLDALVRLIKKKNNDYTAGADDAFANFRRSEPRVSALDGAWARWGDKIQRVDAFFKNGKLEVENEGLDDALKDCIGYSLVMLGILNEQKGVNK